MFENIIGYSKLTAHLTDLIVKRELPQAILVAGKSMSGKQTLATEIARSLLCSQKADWYCSCSHCKNSKTLTHPDVLLLGSIYGMNEVWLAKELVLKHQTKSEVSFFIRAISKILRRADSVIWEQSDAWNKNIRSPLEALMEQLLTYQSDESNWYNEKQIDKAIQATEKLYKAFPQQMMPVQSIRNVIAWSGISTSSLARVVIMNQVEHMLPASANMLLKTLEEPPEKVYFILLTTNPNAILPTIRSRTREFILPQRTSKEEKEILQHIFKHDADESSVEGSNITQITGVKEFLDRYADNNAQGMDDEKQTTIQRLSQEYFQAILHRKYFDERYIMFPAKKGKEVREYGLFFLSCLTININRLLYDNKAMCYFIEAMWKKCARAKNLIQNKNIGVSVVLEDLFYKLQEDYAKILY